MTEKSTKTAQVKLYGHTTYRPEHCFTIVDTFKVGGSMADFCVKVGCGRRTVYQWMHANEEFMQAYLYARECAKSYRDKKIEDNLWVSNSEHAENFNVNAYINLTKTRFRDLNSEHIPTPVFEPGKQPDLRQAMLRLTEHAETGSLSTAQVKAVTGIVTEMMNISQHEDIQAQLKELFDVVADGKVTNNAPVVSPLAETVEAKPKTKAKKKD